MLKISEKLRKENLLRVLLDDKPLCQLLIFVGIVLVLDIVIKKVLKNLLKILPVYIITLTKQLWFRKTYDYC